MTPADRPTGWVLLRADGSLVVHQIYVTLGGADRARERWAASGVRVTVEAVWTWAARDAAGLR